MKYDAFVKKTRALPSFGLFHLLQLGDTKRNAQNQLVRWEKEGRIWRLKRGLYTLPDDLRAAPLSPRWLANHLYSPSYISLDFALSFYELIPELVTTITSISIAKTASFQNPLGRFTYQALKQERFFGFEETPDEQGTLVRMAAPEKALLDRISFDASWKADADYLEEGLRLQNLSQLKPQRLKEYAERFSSKKISNACALLLTSRRES